MLVALAELPQITPLKVAKIGIIGRCVMLLDQLERAAEVTAVQGLVGDVDVGDVFVQARETFAGESTFALALGLRAQPAFLVRCRHCAILGLNGANCLPDTDDDSDQQCGGNCRSGGKGTAMPADEFLKAISGTWRASCYQIA